MTNAAIAYGCLPTAFTKSRSGSKRLATLVDSCGQTRLGRTHGNKSTIASNRERRAGIATDAPAHDDCSGWPCCTAPLTHCTTTHAFNAPEAPSWRITDLKRALAKPYALPRIYNSKKCKLGSPRVHCPVYSTRWLQFAQKHQHREEQNTQPALPTIQRLESHWRLEYIL